MADNTLEIYKAFAGFLLPEGVLDFFDMVEFTVDEETNGVFICKETLHIYLEEKDNRTGDQRATSISNGFEKPKQILDFPIRDKRTVIHVSRRRWRDANGKSFMVDLPERAKLEHTGTRYSKEFAIFLKMADGQRAGDGPFHWPNIYDNA